MACFRCNTTEIFIFLLKYCQRKVDLNISKKSLVFVTIRQKISSLRSAIVYENFMFTRKYAFTKRCCFLTFSFEGKLRKYDIFGKRKHTKINENMIFSTLFTNSRKTKILFFIRCSLWETSVVISPANFLIILSLIFLVFQSTSINAKRKFWRVPHLPHICVFVFLQLWLLLS